MVNGSSGPTMLLAKRWAAVSAEEGQIFIEPQGFCVMAGIGLETGHAQKALDSVAKKLETKYGIVLQTPRLFPVLLEPRRDLFLSSRVQGE